MRIRHKALRALAEENRGAQLPGDLVGRLRRILTGLDVPSARGTSRRAPATGISGNWRVVFRFEGIEVDLVDYH